MQLKYNNTAIFLHWFIALAIILQLAGGLWMVRAIHADATKELAYNFYQYHKAIGLTILVASLFRLIWRLMHKAPPLPDHMNLFERFAANASHIAFYFLMIAIPLLGWAMVSTSPYGLPTLFFDLFEWPHLSFLTDSANKAQINELSEEGHEYASYLMILLVFVHIAAALKHQFFDKDNLINRMIPWRNNENS